MNKKSKKPDETNATDEDISSSQPLMPAPTSESSGKLLDVGELSKKTGNRIKQNGHNPFNVKGFGPMHRAADTLHGWSDYQHHYQQPMRLSESDYLAAIKAAGNYQTHPAAIAPHRK